MPLICYQQQYETFSKCYVCLVHLHFRSQSVGVWICLWFLFCWSFFRVFWFFFLFWFFVCFVLGFLFVFLGVLFWFIGLVFFFFFLGVFWGGGWVFFVGLFGFCLFVLFHWVFSLPLFPCLILSCSRRSSERESSSLFFSSQSSAFLHCQLHGYDERLLQERQVLGGPSDSEKCFQSKVLNRKCAPCSPGFFHVCVGSVRTPGHEERSHPVHRKLYHKVPSMFLVKRIKVNLG